MVSNRKARLTLLVPRREPQRVRMSNRLVVVWFSPTHYYATWWHVGGRHV
jgi:hypothetical protein